MSPRIRLRLKFKLDDRTIRSRMSLENFNVTHANLHYIVAEISRIAIALEIAGRVSAGSVSAHSAHDLAFVDVCAKKKEKKRV